MTERLENLSSRTVMRRAATDNLPPEADDRPMECRYVVLHQCAIASGVEISPRSEINQVRREISHIILRSEGVPSSITCAGIWHVRLSGVGGFIKMRRLLRITR